MLTPQDILSTALSLAGLVCILLTLVYAVWGWVPWVHEGTDPLKISFSRAALLFVLYVVFICSFVVNTFQ